MYFLTLLFFAYLSCALASPTPQATDAPFHATHCNDPELGLTGPGDTNPDHIIELTGDAQAAVDSLKANDLSDDTVKMLASQRTNYRTVGDFTAYVWNDTPCPIRISGMELTSSIEHIKEMCVDNTTSKVMVGYTAMQKTQDKDQWREYGVISTKAFLERVAYKPLDEKEKQWGQKQESCVLSI